MLPFLFVEGRGGFGALALMLPWAGRQRPGDSLCVWPVTDSWGLECVTLVSQELNSPGVELLLNVRPGKKRRASSSPQPPLLQNSPLGSEPTCRLTLVVRGPG